MENYYRSFYPYRFYSPFNFRAYPYGRGNYSANRYSKNEGNISNLSYNSSNCKNNSKQDKSETKEMEDGSNPIFEIFGIKLFFDDILLISLIFFLYSEGVKDQNLFIALILLLLS